VSRTDRAQPERELDRGAAIRDLMAGLMLFGLGVQLGGSSLASEPDAMDYGFDVLAALWISWALLRLARPRISARAE
jgi:hypothetical protein